MPIRQAKKLSPDVFESQFIRIPEGTNSTVITNLENQWENGLEAMKTTAQSAQSSVYQNSDQVYSDFVGFDQFIEWQVSNINTLSAQNVTDALLNFLELTALADYQTSNKKKLWETVVVCRILETSSETIDESQNVLRVLNLIDKLIAVDSSTSSTIGLQKLHFATIVLPSAIFPLPFEKITADPAGELPKDNVLDEYDQAYMDSVLAAKQELEALYITRSNNFSLNSYDKTQFYGLYRDLSFQVLSRGKTEMESDSTKVDKKFQDYLSKGGASGSKNNRGFLTTAEISSISSGVKSVLNELKIDLTKSLLSTTIQLIDEYIQAYAKKKSLKKGYLKSRAIGNALVSFNSFPEQTSDSTPPASETLTTPLVKPLGVGDYLIVQQRLVRYEETEIAHIENVLRGEHFERTHRNLSRTEDYSEIETETNELTESDSRTSERFELSSEIDKIVENSTNTSAGATISAEYGPVSGSAYLNYSSYNSAINASSESSNYAKETVNRALKRIEKRTRQLRSTFSLNEQETVTTHGINNSVAPVDHTIGIYYWLDKIYKAKLVNIGRRLTYEFMVPEPAAFHMFSKLYDSFDKNSYVKSPIIPSDASYYETPLNSHRDISETNYHLWCSRYNVTEISPPPPFVINVAKGIAGTESGNRAITDVVTIPSGYKPNCGTIVGERYGSYVKCVIGEHRLSLDVNPEWDSSGTWVSLGNYKESVPVAILAHEIFAINVIIECVRTAESFEQWQIATYNTIMKSYDTMLQEYNDSLEDTSFNRDFGQNPQINREVERTELKRSAIELFSLQRFENFDAMFDGDISNLPKFAFQDSIDEGKFVRFFEQAFEWENMTYEFYPYFWGKKKNWIKINSISDGDPIFEKFLKAGFARVVVPVRPSYLLSILHYQKTGLIWEGADQPIIDDETLASILTDVNEISTYPDGMELDEWEVRVPTNLVKLRAILPENEPGLPTFE
jgi:hypothetical protein